MPSAERSAAIAQLVLTSLLPALVERDLDEFGAALTDVQRLVGDAFADVQGGRFHPRAAALVEALLHAGAAGAGQSSWGPAVYGVVGSESAGREIASRMERVLDGAGSVELVGFDNRGARVEPVMRLLVSVVDEGEARAAAAAGADIVDVKNPGEGSLGAPSPAIIEGVRAAVPAQLPVSAAIGDMPNLPGTAALAALGAARCGAAFVKVGLWGATTEPEAVALLRAVRDAVAGVPGTVVVAAAYADARRVAHGPLAPELLVRAARAAGVGRLPARHGGQGRPRAPGLALARRADGAGGRGPRRGSAGGAGRRAARRGSPGGPRHRRRHRRCPVGRVRRRQALGVPRGGARPCPARRLRGCYAGAGVSLSPETCRRWAHMLALRSRVAAGTASPQTAAASWARTTSPSMRA